MLASEELVDHLIHQVLVVGYGESWETHIPLKATYFKVTTNNLHLKESLAQIMAIFKLIIMMCSRGSLFPSNITVRTV